VKRFIDSSQDQLGAINSAIRSDVVEQINEITLRLKGFDDRRLRRCVIGT
jgi:hypothetical protein